MKYHHYWLIGGGLLAGFFLANAPSGTGIYGLSAVGQTLANVYTAGAKAGNPTSIVAS